MILSIKNKQHFDKKLQLDKTRASKCDSQVSREKYSTRHPLHTKICFQAPS